MLLKKEIFRRGVRMTHRFGEILRQGDPVGTGTFEASWPKAVSDLGRRGPGHACEVGEYGESTYRLHSSPVSKPTGSTATLRGPSPDLPQEIAMPIPVGTKRRFGPLKTDK